MLGLGNLRGEEKREVGADAGSWSQYTIES